jgi:GxxExxY protein
MGTNGEKAGDHDKLLFRDEVFQIVGCAIEVLNTLGHGLIEKPYENALVVEFWGETNSVSTATNVRCAL